MTNNTLLDVDETILMNNLLLSKNECEDEINQMMSQYNKKSIYIPIQPVPGICIKTKSTAGEKVFLNICTSTKIPPPKDISSAMLLDTLNEETPNFSIPMSIGNARLEPDKCGILCSTHDIIINTTYFEKCQEDEQFLVLTIAIIIEGISYKFNNNLNPNDYIILKNRKVMGKLQEQRIENRELREALQPKKPLIEELKTDNKSTCENTQSQPQNDFPQQNSYKYIILKQPLGKSVQSLIGLFQIPRDISHHDITVLLGTDRIVVTDSGNDLAHDISIPYTIQIENSKGSFDKNLRILRLDMPVVQNNTDIYGMVSNKET